MRFRTMWLAKYKFQNFIVGVAEIIDGAVKVVTLGFVGTHLSYGDDCVLVYYYC